MKVPVICKKKLAGYGMFEYIVDLNKPSLGAADNVLKHYAEFCELLQPYCNCTDFEETYGFSVEQACDPNSEMYILQDIVDRFKNCHNWGLALIEALENRQKENTELLTVSQLMEKIEERYDFDEATIRLIRNCLLTASDRSVDTTELREILGELLAGIVDLSLVDRVTLCEV